MGEQKNPISSIYKAKRKIKKKEKKNPFRKKNEIEAWRKKNSTQKKKKKAEKGQI